MQRGDDPDEVIWGHVRVLALPRDATDDDHTAYARGGLDGARQWLAAVLCDWCDQHATAQLLAHGDTRRPELACPVHTRQWVGDRPIGYPAPRPLPRLEA